MTERPFRRDADPARKALWRRASLLDDEDAPLAFEPALLEQLPAKDRRRVGDRRPLPLVDRPALQKRPAPDRQERERQLGDRRRRPDRTRRRRQEPAAARPWQTVAGRPSNAVARSRNAAFFPIASTRVTGTPVARARGIPGRPPPEPTSINGPRVSGARERASSTWGTSACGVRAAVRFTVRVASKRIAAYAANRSTSPRSTPASTRSAPTSRSTANGRRPLARAFGQQDREDRDIGRGDSRDSSRRPQRPRPMPAQFLPRLARERTYLIESEVVGDRDCFVTQSPFDRDLLASHIAGAFEFDRDPLADLAFDLHPVRDVGEADLRPSQRFGQRRPRGQPYIIN